MAASGNSAWKDLPDKSTPINATALNNIETALADVPAEGAPGPKGDKGDTGAAGVDGFPSEADWNALVARVEALEVDPDA